ncbi:ABC transporter permease [Faecalibacterium gallinarum]|uniref:Multidrug ABC transporter permease n=1 Tax=Faecalibacterium gallinarum TaxID=2903556 RepID=A0AA37IZD9_9FIRM|nr:ABC transporter permease [Faecalibacterium gallinarum]GJN65005.1 multidrug ABC transporter permease [Faecalibacterium gallinarum]
MLLRCLKAELYKCRRSPVWLAFLVLPVFPALLGTGNYLANIEVLDNGWYSLWGQHTLFSSVFFLPALLGVFCGWQWRLEHADHNWNSFLTAPVPVGALYAAKLILAAGVSLLAQGWIGGLYLLSGKLAGLSGSLPPELPGWLLFGALGGISVCAVQLFFSMVIRAFAPPVAFGLAGGILGLMVTAQGWGYAFPYSLLCLGMRANNPQMELDLSFFFLSALGYTGVFVLLALGYLRRRDAAAE